MNTSTRTEPTIPQGFLKYSNIQVKNVEKRPLKLDSSLNSLEQIAQAARNDRYAQGFDSQGQLYAYFPSVGSSDWISSIGNDIYIKDSFSSLNYIPYWQSSVKDSDNTSLTQFPQPFPFVKSNNPTDIVSQLDGAWILLNIDTGNSSSTSSSSSLYGTFQEDYSAFFTTSKREAATPIYLKCIDPVNLLFNLYITYGYGSKNVTDLRTHQIHYQEKGNILSIETDESKMTCCGTWKIYPYDLTSSPQGTFKIVRASDSAGLDIWQPYNLIQAINYPSSIQKNEIIIPPDHKRIDDYILNGRGQQDCCNHTALYSPLLENHCTALNYYPGSTYCSHSTIITSPPPTHSSSIPSSSTAVKTSTPTSFSISKNTTSTIPKTASNISSFQTSVNSTSTKNRGSTTIPPVTMLGGIIVLGIIIGGLIYLFKRKKTKQEGEERKKE